MKKFLAGGMAALLCITMSGCAVGPGGTVFIIGVVLGVLAVALLLFVCYRIKQRMDLLKRHSRSFPRKLLRKADALTAVFCVIAVGLGLGSTIMFSRSSHMVVNTPSSDTVVTVEDETVPSLPWMTFTADTPITTAKYFVYSDTQDVFLDSTVDETETLDPAQLVSVFTAFIVSERAEPNEMMDVTEEILALVPESAPRCGFTPGTRQSAKTLVEAMLVTNASDAAYILAVNIGRTLLGSVDVDKSTIPVQDAVDRFVLEMNTRAKANDMLSTVFMNPDGSPAEGQVTTVKDMITLTNVITPYATIIKFLQTDSFTYAPNEYEDYTWENENKLVVETNQYFCPYAIGTKLMHRDETSYSLLAVFQSNGQELIIGALDCDGEYNAFKDTLQLYNLNMGVY